MEIIRRDELQELLDVVRMKPYGKFLITGAAGSGKTFLLNIIGKILEEQGREIWYETMDFSQMGKIEYLDEIMAVYRVIPDSASHKRGDAALLFNLSMYEMRVY